ncbi:MAG: alpha/beta fold hydrolase [Planctomycetales bacterium]|nr:alpha/beta fold hydrolase [Planctomycetales bacterium]
MESSDEPTHAHLRRLTFPPFVPNRWLRGGHRQTLAAAFGPRAPAPYSATPFDLRLDDGDTLVVHDDTPAGWTERRGLAMLWHGLGGCHLSSYMTRLQHHLNGRGVRTWRVDQRGFGQSQDCHGLGHAGRSNDVQRVVVEAIERHPAAPLWLFGFSMGGNLVLRAAGQWAEQAPPQLRAVAAVAPPVDLQSCAERLRQGWSRIYDRKFVRRLMRALRDRQQLPGSPLRDMDLSFTPRDLLELDDRITAPLAGFSGAAEYYRIASAKPLLPRVAVPTMILAAADDPVVPVDVYADVEASAENVQLHVTSHGGHVGFFARRAGDDPDRCWLDWRLLDFWAAHNTAN